MLFTFFYFFNIYIVRKRNLGLDPPSGKQKIRGRFFVSQEVADIKKYEVISLGCKLCGQTRKQANEQIGIQSIKIRLNPVEKNKKACLEGTGG